MWEPWESLEGVGEREEWWSLLEEVRKEEARERWEEEDLRRVRGGEELGLCEGGGAVDDDGMGRGGGAT